MRVLLVTGGFAGPGRQPWLMDDLATALVESGHIVDVVVGDAKAARPSGVQPRTAPGLTIFSAGITRTRGGRLGRLVGHVTVGFKLHTRAFSWVKRRRYDLCVFTSPASFSWGFPLRVRKAGVTKHNLLFLWDFFPIHQLEIGRINLPWLGAAMKTVERRAIDSADTVALMSPANTKFFLVYHRGARNDTIEVPPWSCSKPTSSTATPEPPLTVVFGGQIAKGRGVDTLVETAALLEDHGTPVRIVVAGDGPERATLEKRAHDLHLTNIEFLGALPREQYRELARSAHLGIAITVPGVTPPSFPSKIVEYCSLGLPVVVCVEESSDAGDFVMKHGAGFAVPAGDPQALADCIERVSALLTDGALEAVSKSALALFESHLSVHRVVETLVKVTED